MKVSKLREKSFPVAIDFGDGDVVNMQMRPHVDGQAQAQALKAKLEASEDDQETIGLIRDKFFRTITEWDLEDDTGNVIPLTAEGVTAADVPVSLLGTLLVRGYEEVNLGKKRGARR